MDAYLFLPGTVVATPGVLELAEKGLNLTYFLNRHLTGDYGELDNFDKLQNTLALKNGERIFSAYNTKLGRLWIITGGGITTFLLPNEY